jgi:hypothetical protein
MIYWQIDLAKLQDSRQQDNALLIPSWWQDESRVAGSRGVLCLLKCVLELPHLSVTLK